jgi:pyrroline-5-carboxylate reductase
MKKDYTVAFIGAGNMGEAMIKGLIASGVASKSIKAMEVDPSRLKYIVGEYKVSAIDKLDKALACDALVLAVKPQVLDEVVSQLKTPGAALPLIISIAAGVKVQSIIHHLGKKARVIRVMPNTPALIGEGVSAYYVGSGCSKTDVGLAESIISSLGPCHKVSAEYLMDAVTGLSGSGPAYVFMFIETLADAGVNMGLTRAMALDLAARTVAGAARMVIETGEHPAVLRDKVASPGGTTIAAIAELEKAGFRAAVHDAVEIATDRSIELGE